MFTHNRLRFQSTVVELLILLEQHLDQGAFNMMDIPHAASSPDISYISTASAPSLRARDSTVSMASGRPSYLAGEEGGNVKVVVRVRKFLPRGMQRTWFICLPTG